MNDSCVAVAADSAATLRDNKIFNANKIFNLSKFNPVGIMFYQNSTISKVPVETLTKIYRKKLGNLSFDTLEEYGESFLRFLSTGSPLGNAQKSEQVIPEESKDEAIITSFIELAKKIGEEVDKEIFEDIKSGKIKIDDIFDVSTDAVNKVIKKRLEDVMKNVPPSSKTKINKTIKILNEIICDDYFLKPLSPVFRFSEITLSIISEIKNLYAHMIVSTKHLPFNYTGIIIMGFGEKDCYPTCVEYIVDGCFKKELKVERKEVRKVGPGKWSFIEVFAQKDVASTFLEGASPNMIKQITGVFENILNDATVAIADSQEDNKLTKEEIIELNKPLLKTLEDRIKKYQKSFVDPMKNAVAFLPKDEMAQMAESLVNITSLRRRVSKDTETVGGPTDVAVLSKGDGFVWIKRKHYFNLEINPCFVDKYYTDREGKK
jgi:hypothetical protein